MSVPALEEAFEKVSKLAATFQANEARYLSPDYQEAEARKDFIDKFFIALGWDVNHDQQTNPYEQEVKVEPPVSAAGQRRADYAFHLAPNYRDVRFFVEAKKPHGDIATADNYFQTIRYAWGSGTPLAALTDFEQLHVLDCRGKPDIETALFRHVAKYHYTEYIDRKKFAEIYWLFSREAVADGSLEKRAKELPKPRGKAVQRGLFPGGYPSIDESFLQELDKYRTALAHAFKNKNPKLDSETLTELTQRTLDRLVFLRFLEDKGIEPQRLVDKFGDKRTAWEDFIAASRRLDDIYNGIVFKHHDILDGDKFRVDDTTFADICESLAHVNSPYDFDAIPIHILGSIYERFLGNVIVATDKRAKVEPKPEVRKAGGVYYTPEYIVRYIVENTVGKLIAGKSPDQIAEMRFADIACGSGSFLLAVFDLLLTYHGHYYNDKPSKARKGDCIKHDGKLYLSLGKKREILLQNIYGVDIDAQAVEVCQLSLYLRLLKDETTASTHQYLLDFEHIAHMKKLLPDLSRNIVCGNSLIGRDILEGRLFATKEERKLNPMNFEDAFPEVMKRGGFDCIIGNPPYIRMLIISKDEIDYFSGNYDSATGHYDAYVLFVEKGAKLLDSLGLLGMIVPHKFFQGEYGKGLRGFLAARGLSQIVDFADQQVFSKASTYTCLLFATPGHRESFTYHNLAHVPALHTELAALSSTITDSQSATSILINQASLSSDAWNFHVGGASRLMPRLKSEYPVVLLDYCQRIYQGLATTADPIYIVEHVANLTRNLTKVRSKITGSELDLEAGILRPLLKGADIRRYHLQPCRYYCIFPYTLENGKAEIITPERMREEFSRTLDYLRSQKSKLDQREHGKMAKRRDWYGYSQEHNLQYFEAPKILTQVLASRATFMLDGDGHYYFVGGGNAGGYGIVLKSTVDVSYQYVLGLLNSKLLDFFLKQVSTRFRGGYYSYAKRFIQQLPIRLIDMTDRSDKARHDEMVAKVDAMLEAKKLLAKAKTDKDKTYYENKCAALDRQIDRLVYDLYGLTEKEIQIVEQQK